MGSRTRCFAGVRSRGVPPFLHWLMASWSPEAMNRVRTGRSVAISARIPIELAYGHVASATPKGRSTAVGHHFSALSYRCLCRTTRADAAPPVIAPRGERSGWAQHRRQAERGAQITHPVASSIRCMLSTLAASRRGAPSRAPALGLTRAQTSSPLTRKNTSVSMPIGSVTSSTAST
jgi:hypothetical protein